jgi:simple sugar transport system permease protein
MLAAGAAAGLAGWIQVAGVDRAVYLSVARGTGFSGVLVAVMGGARVGGTLVASFFFAALATGGDYMQIAAGVSPFLVSVVQGAALLIVASPLVRKGAPND